MKWEDNSDILTFDLNVFSLSFKTHWSNSIQTVQKEKVHFENCILRVAVLNVTVVQWNWKKLNHVKMSVGVFRFVSYVNHSTICWFIEQNNDQEKEKDVEGKDVEEKLLNTENGQQVIPYPKRVFLILGTEFCERFNYYGMRSIFSILWTKGNLQ